MEKFACQKTTVKQGFFTHRTAQTGWQSKLLLRWFKSSRSQKFNCFMWLAQESVETRHGMKMLNWMRQQKTTKFSLFASQNHPAFVRTNEVSSFAPTHMNINFMCLNCQKGTSRQFYNVDSLPESSKQAFHCCHLWTSWINCETSRNGTKKTINEPITTRNSSCGLFGGSGASATKEQVLFFPCNMIISPFHHKLLLKLFLSLSCCANILAVEAKERTKRFLPKPCSTHGQRCEERYLLKWSSLIWFALEFMMMKCPLLWKY